MISDWLLYFRSLDTATLTAKRTALDAEMTIYSSQTAGSKSGTRDLRELRDQLNAITYVLKERGLTPGVNNFIGTTDFSRVTGTGGLQTPNDL